MPLQYDTPTTPEEVINAMASNPSISEETRQQIENILGISSGIAAPVNVGTFDGSTLTGPAGPIDMLIITPPAPSVPGAMVDIQIPEAVLQQAQAYVFQTSENINVVFNTVERVIVSGSGNDKMTVNGDKNTTLDGSGGNDTLVTSGGNDSVSGGDGNDSISAATGNDTIVSGLGSDTIDGGAGRDTVKFAGNKSDSTSNWSMANCTSTARPIRQLHLTSPMLNSWSSKTVNRLQSQPVWMKQRSFVCTKAFWVATLIRKVLITGLTYSTPTQPPRLELLTSSSLQQNSMQRVRSITNSSL